MDEKFGMRRIYRKSWPYDNLFGTLRHELDSAQRGIWNDLLDFAKLSRVRPGLIAPNEKTAYKHEWLAAFLNVPIELLENTLEVLKSSERIIENGYGIEILNWGKYQTEYDRQKPYREAKKAEKDDPEKFKRGKYGGMVMQSRADMEARHPEKAKRMRNIKKLEK